MLACDIKWAKTDLSGVSHKVIVPLSSQTGWSNDNVTAAAAEIMTKSFSGLKPKSYKMILGFAKYNLTHC